MKDSAVLGRGALPQKALESVLKTAAFPPNLETGVSLRFREPSDAVGMQLEQSWIGICVRAGVSLHHDHLLGVLRDESEAHECPGVTRWDCHQPTKRNPRCHQAVASPHGNAHIAGLCSVGRDANGA